jgi:hypothetical protein
VTRVSALNAQIATLAFRGLVGHARNCGVLFSGVGVTLAVQGDDRLFDTHVSQHSDIYHSGSSRFGSTDRY